MLKVIYCGARWLGMECLKELSKYSTVEIIGVVLPKKSERASWQDVKEEEVIKKLKLRTIDWQEAEEIKSIDLVFSVCHGPIFKEPYISSVQYGVINLHPGPLPYYRGRNLCANAIMNGEAWFGVTLHYIDEGIDTGPIIDISWLDIFPDDTGKMLFDRTQRLAKRLFQEKLPDILESAKKGKRVSAYKQDNNKAHYYNAKTLINKEVNLFWSREKIYNFVRALQFPTFEPAFFKYKDKKIYLAVQNGNIIIHSEYQQSKVPNAK